MNDKLHSQRKFGNFNFALPLQDVSVQPTAITSKSIVARERDGQTTTPTTALVSYTTGSIILFILVPPVRMF